jgi:hypothetical protein
MYYEETISKKNNGTLYYHFSEATFLFLFFVNNLRDILNYGIEYKIVCI